MSETPQVDPIETESEALPTFGWNAYAERLNGRFAMVGIIAIVLIEIITGQGVLSWIGLR